MQFQLGCLLKSKIFDSNLKKNDSSLRAKQAEKVFWLAYDSLIEFAFILCLQQNTSMGGGVGETFTK